MPKIMLINVTHSEESRVGIVSNNVLEAFEIESLSREHLKGNIYKGVVHRIHPALEAAFVDIGADRDAFLPLDEICFRNLPRTPKPAEGNGRRRHHIRDLLRPGEEILVQITKEQFANKPPTLTTFYSLPGRYLVLLPGTDETGISRRIEGEDRVRLRKLAQDLNPPEGIGLIVRTAAGMDEEAAELNRDFTYLLRLWENVRKAAEHRGAPALVYREHDIVLRTIRDFFTVDVDEIYIDNEEVFHRAHDFLSEVMPGKEHVLHLYRGDQPIFSAFDVESQIESVFRRRVQLRSGASIVIDGTEALTAIDVNSGGSVRGKDPEETAFRTNQEATAEIARQLRLRDIGGLIVVDFIDMREGRHVHEIERAMRDALRPDKARHEVGHISRFGLMEISRQRLRPAAMATTYTACPMCEGHGAVRTTESAALVALRKIHNRVSQGDVSQLEVALPNSVAMYLLNQKRDELARLEERYNTRIQIRFSERLMPHEIEIEVRQRPAGTVAPPKLAPGAVAERAPASAAGAADADGAGKKRKRRRGRRRGSGLRAASAIGEAFSALGRMLGFTEPEQQDSAPSADVAPDDDGRGTDEAATRTPTASTNGGEASGRGRRRRRRRSGGRRGEGRGAPAAGVTAGPDDERPPAPGAKAAGKGERAETAPSATIESAAGRAEAESATVTKKPASRRPRRRGTKRSAAKESAEAFPAEAPAAGGAAPRDAASLHAEAPARSDAQTARPKRKRATRSSAGTPSKRASASTRPRRAKKTAEPAGD